MPHVAPITQGRTFFCPHCGALYSVTHSRPAEGDNDTAKCVVCLQIMATHGETAEVPIFKLIHRPEDA
jgi:transcription elongation factor Elf1